MCLCVISAHCADAYLTLITSRELYSTMSITTTVFATVIRTSRQSRWSFYPPESNNGISVHLLTPVLYTSLLVCQQKNIKKNCSLQFVFEFYFTVCTALGPWWVMTRARITETDRDRAKEKERKRKHRSRNKKKLYMKYYYGNNRNIIISPCDIWHETWKHQKNNKIQKIIVNAGNLWIRGRHTQNRRWKETATHKTQNTERKNTIFVVEAPNNVRTNE